MPVRNYFKAVMLIGSLGRVKLLTPTKLRIGAQSIIPHSHNPERRLIEIVLPATGAAAENIADGATSSKE